MKWFHNTDHHCPNCDHRVATRAHNGDVQVFGTPDNLKEVSNYPDAPPKKPALKEGSAAEGGRQ
jgi:hypothetical protein